MANSTPVQSIDRVFDIVEALSSSPHGMSLTDLAAAVGLHVSTVHSLLASLWQYLCLGREENSRRDRFF